MEKMLIIYRNFQNFPVKNFSIFSFILSFFILLCGYKYDKYLQKNCYLLLNERVMVKLKVKIHWYPP